MAETNRTLSGDRHRPRESQKQVGDGFAVKHPRSGMRAFGHLATDLAQSQRHLERSRFADRRNCSVGIKGQNLIFDPIKPQSRLTIVSGSISADAVPHYLRTPL